MINRIDQKIHCEIIENHDICHCDIKEKRQ